MRYRYKVLSIDDIELAGFNTAQSVADYLFTLHAEEISGLYVLDTNGEGFCFSTYERTSDALTGTVALIGTVYKTRIDAIYKLTGGRHA